MCVLKEQKQHFLWQRKKSHSIKDVSAVNWKKIIFNSNNEFSSFRTLQYCCKDLATKE